MKHLKVASALLSAVMCITMVTAPVMADETETPSETQTVETAEEKEAEESEDSEEKEPGVVEEMPAEGEDQKEALDAVLAKGKCGKKVKWSLDKKGTLKITGKGAMKNYTFSKTTYAPTTPWIKYATKIKKVTISKKVTTVGDLAFVYCTNLRSVKLPKKLKSIGMGAFYMCTSLKSISIPKKVKTIGVGAFSTTGLTSVVLPKSVKNLGSWAFENCKSLGSVKFSSNLNSIGENAFVNCEKLQSITIPASVKSIGEYAFSGCSGLGTVNIPISGLTTLGEHAFDGCEKLTNIKIPLSVTTMGSFAFNNCTGLTEAWISSKLDGKTTGTFNGCTKLVGNIQYYTYADPGDECYDESGDIKFKITNPDINGNGTVSLIGFNPALKQLVVPNVVVYKNVSYKVTRIERNFATATTDNTQMESLIIGSNVTSIADKAFGSCIALKSVTGGAKLQTIGREAFANCPKLNVFNISSKTLKKIGPYAFNGATALTTLQLKKTTKLTKSGVKDSLKLSAVKTVKVKKSKVKKYKKIFKKKNCGKKVKVKK